MRLLREYIRSLLIETAIGQCYPHVVKMAKDSSQEEFADLTRFKVAHGRVTDKYSGESVMHAWVEKGDMVFDWQTHSTKPDCIPKDVYYDMYTPEIHDEYTAEETMVNCLKSGQSGPWTLKESVSLEQEEQTELEKLQDIFIRSGVQAVELGKMVLPDAPEVKAMEALLYQIRELLGRFEDPGDDQGFGDRHHRAGRFWHTTQKQLETAIPNTFEYVGQGWPRGTLQQLPVAYHIKNLGTWYAQIDLLNQPRFQAILTSDFLEPAAEWAGAPVPTLPKELLKP